jgi:hypothetical protein
MSLRQGKNKGVASGGGGGIQCGELSTVIVTNNTIIDNLAYFGGGGVSCLLDSTWTITNTILWNNTAPTGSEIYLEGNFSISYSDIDGGQGSVYEDPNGNLTWGSGIIDADPLFIDSSKNDFHINYHSPCVDAGDNYAPNLPVKDIDGEPRIILKGNRILVGSPGTESIVDMGADECHFWQQMYIY